MSLCHAEDTVQCCPAASRAQAIHVDADFADLAQALERIPYETLLRQQQSSSSLPTTPSKARPSWSTVRSHPNPPACHDTLSSKPLHSGRDKTAPTLQPPQAEEENWPDLTQLRWEQGATGVVRGQPSSGDFVEASFPEQSLDAARRGVMPRGSMLADSRLAPSVRVQGRPRWGSPNALPSRPQPHSHSLSRPHQQHQHQQQQQSSYLSQGAQPLYTHVSLDSLVLSPRTDATPMAQPKSFHTSLSELMAHRTFDNEPDEQQNQIHLAEPSWPEDSVTSSVMRSNQPGFPQAREGHQVILAGTDSRSSDQQAPPQQHAPQDWDLDLAKQGEEEVTGAASAAVRAAPSFASPTQSSEAKMKQRSLKATLSGSRGRRSANSTSVDADMSVTRLGHRHQAAIGAVSKDKGLQGVKHAAPLTSTFRSAS